jgi:hypothetical protein
VKFITIESSDATKFFFEGHGDGNQEDQEDQEKQESYGENAI